MTRSVNLPGSRADVRDRATTVAMHLIRRTLLRALSARVAPRCHRPAVLGGDRRPPCAACARGRARPRRLSSFGAMRVLPAEAVAHARCSGRTRSGRRASGGPRRPAGREARGARARGHARALHSDAVLPRQPRRSREIDAIGAALARLRRSAVGELSLGAPAWLPPAIRARSRSRCATRTESSQSLQAPSARRSRGTIDWEPERRRFRAHITSARACDAPRATSRRGGAALSLPATPALSFTPADRSCCTARGCRPRARVRGRWRACGARPTAARPQLRTAVPSAATV